MVRERLKVEKHYREVHESKTEVVWTWSGRD